MNSLETIALFICIPAAVIKFTIIVTTDRYYRKQAEVFPLSLRDYHWIIGIIPCVTKTSTFESLKELVEEIQPKCNDKFKTNWFTSPQGEEFLLCTVVISYLNNFKHYKYADKEITSFYLYKKNMFNVLIWMSKNHEK